MYAYINKSRGISVMIAYVAKKTRKQKGERRKTSVLQ